MKWKGRRASSNVIDARGRRVSGGRAPGGGALIGLAQVAFRLLGFKGLAALAVIGVIGWQLGIVDPAALLGGQAQTTQVDYQPDAAEQERFDFVTVVLADTEDVWGAEFKRLGRSYQPPVLEFYTGRTSTACGMGDARMGPFYCPADRKIYIDLSFYDELAETFQAPGDFAQAYVIAHEVGHHVQNLLGTSARVQSQRGRSDYNQQSVRLELQADYYAGLWARHNHRYLDAGDIEEAMLAANRIGDDAIQLRTQGRVVPHAFTHGTSEQRMRWFQRGLQSGRSEDGDTFSMNYEQL